MRIIGIDPGTRDTAWCVISGGKPVWHAKEGNARVLDRVRAEWEPSDETLAIEMVASYGMPVGREIFETVLTIGRMVEAWGSRGGVAKLIYRKEVKLFHCGSARANDATIRAALLDRYGPGRAAAVGTKSSPGPCYGVKADVWSALAVALTAEGKPHMPVLDHEPTSVAQRGAAPF